MTASCFSQGTIAFINNANSLVRFWDRGGVPVASGQVQLAWAPIGTAYVPWTGSALRWQADNPGWTAIGSPAFVGSPVAGHFSGGVLTANTTPPGAIIQAVVIAWSSRYNSNAPNFIEGERSAFLFGISAPFTVDTGDPTTIPPGFPANINNSTTSPFKGMDIPWIPEPSSFTLFVFGVATWLRICRRNIPRSQKESGVSS